MKLKNGDSDVDHVTQPEIAIYICSTQFRSSQKNCVRQIDAYRPKKYTGKKNDCFCKIVSATDLSMVGIQLITLQALGLIQGGHFHQVGRLLLLDVYVRVCLSVRLPFVRRSVCPSFGLSVRPSTNSNRRIFVRLKLVLCVTTSESRGAFAALECLGPRLGERL